MGIPNGNWTEQVPHIETLFEAAKRNGMSADKVAAVQQSIDALKNVKAGSIGFDWPAHVVQLLDVFLK